MPGPDEDELRTAEALLLASPDPVTLPMLDAALPGRRDDAHLRAVLAVVAERYRGRGIEVAEVAGGWRLRTAPDLGPRLSAALRRARRLPRAAVEALAAIALHQPVTRAEIEEIRGAALAQATMDLLLDLGLIASAGHVERPGRPIAWQTTPVFLEHFGLRSLSDLPRLDHMAALLDLRAAAAGGEPPDDG